MILVDTVRLGDGMDRTFDPFEKSGVTSTKSTFIKLTETSLISNHLGWSSGSGTSKNGQRAMGSWVQFIVATYLGFDILWVSLTPNVVGSDGLSCKIS